MTMRFVLSSVIVGTSIVAVAFFARPRLLPPTGAYAVGTTTIALDAGSLRSSDVAQVWYPAASSSLTPTAPYALRATGLSLRERIVAASVRTSARLDVPVRDARMPVIVYVPGFGGRRFHNTALAQEIASHGYVVVGVDDTVASSGLDFSSADSCRAAVIEGDRKVRLQARDLRGVLDALARLDAGTGPLARRLALDRIGMLGFSFGGAVAAQVAATDTRVRAAVDLDGSIFGDVPHRGARAPFMFVTARTEHESSAEADFDRANVALLEGGLRESGGAMVIVDGADHLNFSDAALLPSLRHTGVGSIDGGRGARIVARYVVAFFNRYVDGRETSFGRSVGDDPSADIRVYASGVRSK